MAHGHSSADLSLAAITAALTVRGWENYWGGEEEGRRAWEVLRNEIDDAAPFWAYSPEVPEELRGGRSLPDYDDPTGKLKRKREEWLRREGYLDEGSRWVG